MFQNQLYTFMGKYSGGSHIMKNRITDISLRGQP